jgi:hypothetical protein
VCTGKLGGNGGASDARADHQNVECFSAHAVLDPRIWVKSLSSLSFAKPPAHERTFVRFWCRFSIFENLSIVGKYR